jgi:hypothetical protein
MVECEKDSRDLSLWQFATQQPQGTHKLHDWYFHPFFWMAFI